MCLVKFSAYDPQTSKRAPNCASEVADPLAACLRFGPIRLATRLCIMNVALRLRSAIGIMVVIGVQNGRFTLIVPFCPAFAQDERIASFHPESRGPKLKARRGQRLLRLPPSSLADSQLAFLLGGVGTGRISRGLRLGFFHHPFVASAVAPGRTLSPFEQNRATKASPRWYWGWYGLGPVPPRRGRPVPAR